MKLYKHLFIIFICFLVLALVSNSYACGVNSVNSLNSCTIRDRFSSIIQKLRPDVPYKFLKQVEGESKSLYERLEMESKPSIADMQAELDAWKALRLPRATFLDELKSIKHPRMAMVRCNLDMPNKAIFVRNLKRDLDRTKLDCLLEKDVEIKAELAEIVSRKNQVEMIRQAIKDWDCTSLNGYVKRLCQYNKARL